MKRRDACEWWPAAREITWREALLGRGPGACAIMHSSWCAKSKNGHAECTCVPITLVFGATA